MEADVAIQHSAEKWAAGESLYEQPEKVAFIYRGPDKRRGNSAAGRLHVRTSRSYDNELEASVYTDFDEGMEGTRVHDDLSVDFGNDFELDPVVLDWNPMPDSVCSSRSAGERYTNKVECVDIHEGRRGHKKTRWKQEQDFSQSSSHKTKHKGLALSPKTDYWDEDFQSQNAKVTHDGRHRSIHNEFHFKENQSPASRPSLQCKRSINLSSQPSSLPTLSPKEKPSSFVIVEVKDGPTFFYRPSDHMLSDSAVDDYAMAPSQYFVAHTSGRHQFSESKDHHTSSPSRNTSFGAYPGNFTFNKPDYSPFSPFRRNSSSSLYLTDSPSSEDSPKTRSTSTIHQLPKTPSLRRPDLSLLSSPSKKRDPIVEEGTFNWIQGCECVHLVGEEEFINKDKKSQEQKDLPEICSSVSEPSVVTTSHCSDMLSLKMNSPHKTLFQGLFKNSISSSNSTHPQNVNVPDNSEKSLNTVQNKSVIPLEIATPTLDRAEIGYNVPSHNIAPSINNTSQSIHLQSVQSPSTRHPVNASESPNYVQSRNDVQPQRELLSQKNIYPQDNFQHLNTALLKTVNQNLEFDQNVNLGQPSTAITDSVVKDSQSQMQELEISPALTAQELTLPGVCSYDSSLVFQNTSEIVQQKAGIKHDDIMVGPRLLRDGLLHRQLELGALRQQAAARNSQPISSSGQHDDLVPKLNLSASVDGLVIGASNISAENESLRRKHTQSESDSSFIDTPLLGSVSDNQTQQVLVATNNKTIDTEDNRRPHLPANKLQLDSKCITNSKCTSGEKGSKIDEKDPQRTMFGDIIKSRTLNLEAPTDASYTKSLDRNHRSMGEAILISKSDKRLTAKSPSKLPPDSKLDIFSNASVPMNHGPPAKSCRPVSFPDVTDLRVPSLVDTENDVGMSSSARSSQLSPTQQPDDILVPVLPQLPRPTGELCTTSSGSSTNALQNVQNYSCETGSRLKQATNREVSTQTQEDENHLSNELTDTHKADISTTFLIQHLLSAAAVDNNEKLQESPANLPGNVPAKPRLHRSTEQLPGDTKLTVFNSGENVPSFDKNEASSNVTLQDGTRLEKVCLDRISSLKKANHELPKSGIMRRGSDRTEMCRRGSDKGFLVISNNDPSVEDLKKATSLKELCQSMASLLNIDNVKAAEMITTSLSNRQDLVEGLDADAIMDYLSHHGVLDPGILVGLDDKSSVAQRNSALIRHVEEHGNTAVALFINALRQSGQLHLASSLDTEQRIKPVSGNTYFGKDRHKGEITVRIEVESLKIIAPREPRHDMIVDTSLLSSPGRPTDGVLVKDADDEDSVKSKSCWCFCFSYKSKIKALSKKDNDKQKSQTFSADESRPTKEAEKKDFNIKPHKTKSQEKAKKGKESKDSATDGSKDLKSQSCPLEIELKYTEESERKNLNIKPKRTKSQEKTKKGKEVKGFPKEASKKDKENSKKTKQSKSKSKVSEKFSSNKIDSSVGELRSVPEVSSQQRADEVQCQFGEELDSSKLVRLRPYVLQPDASNKPSQLYGGVSGTLAASNQGSKPDKEGWDPIIMEYNPQLELIKLRAGQEELSSPTRQSGNAGFMCEQWKSDGRHFQQKASLLCQKIVEELHTDIIKYFEQDRGTLVLDVVADISSILVFNICMMRGQVKCLQQEIADDSLLNKIQDMFFSKVDIAKFDIRGIKMRIILDEQELNIVLSELS